MLQKALTYRVTMTYITHVVTQYITKVVTCTQGNNILNGLEEKEYANVVDMLEKAILATDLAMYFQ